jgi:acetaldehyde dehydrogenase
MTRTKVAVIGAGPVGTYLASRISRRSEVLEVMTVGGMDELMAADEFGEVEIVFDATSAAAHPAHVARLAPYGKTVVDLTPAGTGRYVVPAVNLPTVVAEGGPDLSLVSGAGQAGIPVVAALTRVTPVAYAESVVSLAATSVGPEVRAGIDRLTGTTARALEAVGGAGRGKSVLVLNPGEPPAVLRATVLCLIGDADHEAIRSSVGAMADTVALDVPGYRLRQDVQFSSVPAGEPVHTLVRAGAAAVTTTVAVFVEVRPSGDRLPVHAGDLHLLTSAAVRVAETLAKRSAGDGAGRARAGVAA